MRVSTPASAQLEPAPPLGARAGVLAGAICGVLSLFSTALLATPDVAVFAVACAVVFAAAAWAPVLWPSPGGIAVRRMLSFVLLATTLLLCLVNLLRVQTSDVADLAATFGGFVGRLLISVLLAQLFITDKMRDLRVALLLAVGMFVLAVANDPGRVVVVALLVGWPAVVAVLAFDHAGRERSKADVVARAAPAGQSLGLARVGWFSAVSAVVAVLLVLLVPHPAGIHPRSAGGLAGGGAPVPNSDAPSRGTAAYTSGTLDMRARGQLPGIAVADVPLDSPELWRGAVLGYYDGVSWSAPADLSVGQRLPGGPHFDLPPGDTTFGTGAERRDVVRRRPGFTGVLIAPGQPRAVDVSGGLLHLSGGFLVSGAPGGGYPDSYSVTSTTTDLPHSMLVRTPMAMSPGPQLPADALELPDALPERVRLLGARITRWATDRDSATSAVAAYLRGHETYRLDSPVPPPGEDAVDHFLFVAHTGFCEQFAAAEVVLLRSVGVPARLATGFAGGEPSGDHRTLIGSDAHAWVEVWYPGIGWAASDPTAGSRLAPAGLQDRASSWLRGAAGRLVAAGCLLVVATLVALAVWWLRRRAQRVSAGPAGPAAGRPLPPVLAAFDRLQRALEAAGTPRAPAESVSELARRPAMRPAAAALAVVEATSYGPLAPVGAVADAAERTLNELARQLTADLAATDS